jgi:hypothetical protein
MTGSGFLTLVLVSMAWLLFFAGLAFKLRPLAGIAGSLAAFFTIPLLAKSGIEVPWPWVWILLPLLLLIQKR